MSVITTANETNALDTAMGDLSLDLAPNRGSEQLSQPSNPGNSKCRKSPNRR
jgi:hypothetical protein